MTRREHKKQQTRQALMQSALTLVGEDNNFNSISLREVAKNAGVVPTSFYRHFRDMEELGLHLLDELGLMLRKLMRNTRMQDDYIEALTRESVRVYAGFVMEHRNYFYFMNQSRTGGTPALREAVRTELRYFSNELATDIRRLPIFDQMNTDDLGIITELIVETVFAGTIDLLDRTKTDDKATRTYVDNTIKKLRVIWLGAGEWQS
ncbi:MAG: HTH-type transcriptional repressor FabR [Oleiphilaceae bacterium]|nr:HTH-type transcriptional repressor FabR [Oleiphilaceae bacterium]